VELRRHIRRTRLVHTCSGVERRYNERPVSVQAGRKSNVRARMSVELPRVTAPRGGSTNEFGDAQDEVSMGTQWYRCVVVVVWGRQRRHRERTRLRQAYCCRGIGIA